MRLRSRPGFLVATVLPLAATAFAAASCAPADVKISGDTSIPATTLIDLKPTTSGPPTTPFPTTYPTIPPVSAAPPYWSPVSWSIDVVKEFLALVDTALYDLGAEHTMDSYNGVATLYNGTSIDLTLLAAQLTMQPTSAWKSAIDTYLQSALRPGGTDGSMPWETAQPLLRVRVGTLESFALELGQGIVQPIVGDLVVAVCIEQETSISLASAAQLEAWGRSASQVIALAIRQTLDRPVETKPDGPFSTVVSDPFASARLLDPTVVIPGAAPNGYLVAIPTFGQFAAIAVGDAVTLSTIAAMAEQATEDFATLDNPASADLYWWRGGRVDVLRVRAGEVTVPDALMALLPA